MVVASFTTYFAELFVAAFLILAVRPLLGRWLGPNAKRLLWTLLILKALVPLTLPTPYHPLGLLYRPHPKMAPPILADGLARSSAPVADTHERGVAPVGAEALSPRQAATAAPPWDTSPPETAIAPAGTKADSITHHFNSPQLPGEPKSYNFQTLLLALWLLGALTLLSIAIGRNRTVIKHATRQPVAVPDWVQTLFLECRETLRLSAWPVLIVSPYIPSPCLVGTLRPRILIPESLLAPPSHPTQATETRIRHLLLHELVHLKQGDIWLAWLWTLALAIHWFNPLFWLLGRLLKFDCETACDDRVLTILEQKDRRDYGHSLLQMILELNPVPALGHQSRDRKGATGSVLALPHGRSLTVAAQNGAAQRYIPGSLGIVETRLNLERRLTMMQTHRPPSLLRRLSACGIFLLLVLLCMTSYAQSTPPVSADKAKWMGYVEDYFMNNDRDITMRKTLTWGDPTTDAKGNVSITYKCEALVGDKHRFIFDAQFTFDKDGKLLDLKKESQEIVAAAPTDITQQTLKNGVEKFFGENFRDITARKTLKWGDMKTNADGTFSIDYQCEATIWDKDKLLIEYRFTFDKFGKYLGHETLEKKPLTTDEKAPADKPVAPLILRMLPANGAVDVDPNTPFLMLRFNQKMGNGFSWCQTDPDTFPPFDDKYVDARWLSEHTVALLPVRLEPNKTYFIGLNFSPFTGFRSDGANQPLPAYSYTFKTSNKPFDPQRRQALGDDMRRAIKEATADPTLPVLLQLQHAGIAFTRIDQIAAAQRQKISTELACPLSALYHIYLSDGDAQVNVLVLEKADRMNALKPKMISLGQHEENLTLLSPTTLLEFVPRDLTAEQAKTIRAQLRATPPKPSAANEPANIKSASRKKAQKGWLLFNQNHAAEGEPLFLAATQLDPTNANAWQGLGWTQWAQRKTDEAQKSFDTCLTLDTRNVAALNGLGQIAQSKGNLDKAIAYWTQGTTLDPLATGPIAALAAVYDGKDDYPNAIKYYEMWLRADPSNDTAKSALKKVKEKAAKK
ncbi:MAG: hypothetical protein FWD61_02510 [Phycisphaerales bacterium]|nr:hypothetical protein [Phycisphaerales bacterium]